MRKIWLCLLLLALLGMLLSGCMRRVEAQGYDVYYVEQSAGAASALVPEKHPLPSGRPSVEGLVDLLLSSPQREDLTSAIPEGVTLRKWTLYNGRSSRFRPSECVLLVRPYALRGMYVF